MADEQHRAFGCSHLGAAANPAGFTTVGRLHYATEAAEYPDQTLANVQWCYGPDETVESQIAYITKGGDDLPVLQTTFGDQTELNPDGTPGPGNNGAPDAYVSFKRVNTDAEFGEAIADIATKNGLNVSFDPNDAVAAQTFANENLHYWSNYIIVL